MTLFNIGPVEFIAILIIMFLVLGPEGMVKAAYTIGSWIRKTVRSPLWAEILGYSREIRDLPTRIVRESGLENDLAEIEKVASEATAEAKAGVEAATNEIQATLKDAGSVQIRLENDALKGDHPVMQTSADQKGSPAISVATPAEQEKPKPPVVLD